MSRALDAEVKAVLQADRHGAFQAYRDISTVLAEVRPDALLELELLGRSHPLPPGQSLVRDGAAIGVSKVRLMQAFTVARQLLLQHLTETRQGHDKTAEPAADKGEWERDDELKRASAVLLLAEPEHLTAANTRKRALQRRLAAAFDHDAAVELVGCERALIDSLVTSHLFRHAKSPTLWSHRRWLAEEAGRAGVAWAMLGAGEDGELRRVVMVAAERHPRNYYAWQHARWLLAQSGCRAATADLAREVANWCFRHHSDISGWAFLASVLAALGPDGPDEPAAVRAEIAQGTAEWAESLGWRNESVRWFLAAASSLAGHSNPALYLGPHESPMS